MQAVAAMNFERAARLRDILFPKTESLHDLEQQARRRILRPNYSGYSSDTNQAGRYRRPELNPYLGDADERDHLRGIPVM